MVAPIDARLPERYSSIRKAKGLEADAALVVAKSISELKKWLQTDQSARCADKQDKCRLGYVAFTRPREMLCIACLEQIDDELIRMFQRLGIVSKPGNDSNTETNITLQGQLLLVEF